VEVCLPLAYPQTTHVTINTILPVLDATNLQTSTVHKYNLQKQHTSCLRYPHPFVAIKDTTTTTVVAGAVSHSTFSERVSSHLHTSRPPTIMCYRDALLLFHMSKKTMYTQDNIRQIIVLSSLLNHRHEHQHQLGK